MVLHSLSVWPILEQEQEKLISEQDEVFDHPLKPLKLALAQTFLHSLPRLSTLEQEEQAGELVEQELTFDHEPKELQATVEQISRHSLSWLLERKSDSVSQVWFNVVQLLSFAKLLQSLNWYI